MAEGETVDVLMITHRRAHYTELSLPRLLESADDRTRVWLWHNGDDQETIDVIRRYEHHPRLHRLHVNPQNVGLREPTNWLWRESDGDFLAKVDDDCLVPTDWIRPLRHALASNPELGVVALWLYFDEDFIPELALRKVEELDGGCQIMRHPWVQGSGYMMRRECIRRHGTLGAAQSWTQYCSDLSRAGWTVGFTFPFIQIDHMDDPRSPNTRLKSDADMEQWLGLSAAKWSIGGLQAWEDHIRFGGFLLQHWPATSMSERSWQNRLRRKWTELMYYRWERRRRAAT